MVPDEIMLKFKHSKIESELALVKRLVYPALTRRLSLNIKNISTASMNESEVWSN